MVVSSASPDRCDTMTPQPCVRCARHRGPNLAWAAAARQALIRNDDGMMLLIWARMLGWLSEFGDERAA